MPTKNVIKFTFKTVEEAEKYAKEKLGLKNVDYAGNLAFANLSNMALQDAKNCGIDLNELCIAPFDKPVPSDISAQYYWPTKKLSFNNRNYEHDWNKIVEKGINISEKSGDYASTLPQYTIHHELGHYVHFKYNFDLARTAELLNHKILSKDYNLSEKEREMFGIFLRYRNLMRDDTINKQVSHYGNAGIHEFVAEVFAGQMAGKKYSDEIMQLYKDAGGFLPQKTNGK